MQKSGSSNDDSKLSKATRFETNSFGLRLWLDDHREEIDRERKVIVPKSK